jgi:hypothetical protein
MPDIVSINEEIEKEVNVNEEGEVVEGSTEKPVEEGEQLTSEEQHEEDSAQNDEEREAIRARRRQERQDKKRHRQDKEESYRREIEGLRRQVSDMNEWKNTVEQRRVQSGIGQIDRSMKEANDAIEIAKQAIREATETQNGAALVDAQELYYAARKRSEELSQFKQRVNQQMQQRPQQNIDPSIAKNAQKWMDGKDWYDPVGKNSDSKIALTVDNGLAEEGWDPRTPEYWEELDSRLKKYLPHRFTGGNAPAYNDSNSSQRRSPTGGSGQGKSQGSGTFTLSPDRVKAMKEAGMWDDPEKRKRMTKRYMDMDKQNRN